MECQTFTVKNNWHSQNFNFLRKKIWRNVLALKGKNVQGIFREMFILALSSSAVFHLQTVSQISINMFCSGDKRLLSDFLQKWSWFHEHNDCFQIFSFKTKLLLCLFFFLLFSLLNLDFIFNVVCNFLRTLMYFSENYNLNDSAISLPVFPSRTNLKLHNISITPKMVKKFIMG